MRPENELAEKWGLLKEGNYYETGKPLCSEGETLIDTHSHLQMPEFAPRLARGPRQRREGRHRARGRNRFRYRVEHRRAIALCEQNGDCWLAWVFIRMIASSLDEAAIEQLRQIVRHPRWWRWAKPAWISIANLSPRENIRGIRDSILLAEEVGLPIIVHDRDAHDEVRQTLASHCASWRAA